MYSECFIYSGFSERPLIGLIFFVFLTAVFAVKEEAVRQNQSRTAITVWALVGKSANKTSQQTPDAQPMLL